MIDILIFLSEWFFIFFLLQNDYQRNLETSLVKQTVYSLTLHVSCFTKSERCIYGGSERSHLWSAKHLILIPIDHELQTLKEFKVVQNSLRPWTSFNGLKVFPCTDRDSTFKFLNISRYIYNYIYPIINFEVISACLPACTTPPKT